MTDMVQVTVAQDITEAEEIEAMLAAAGIAVALEPAVEHHPAGTEDAPVHVLVPAGELEAAQHAIEAMSDPDELIADA